ncbi:MAG: RNA polymerase sigma factor [Ktedonobacterales bacterium]
MSVAVPWRSWKYPRTRWISAPAISHALGLLTSRPQAEEAEPKGSQPVVSSLDGGEAMDEAFETFFRLHEREIFGYLWHITGDEQASYDIAQETFVRAWQRFEQIRRYEQPRAWLFRVATNLASNHRRNRSVRDAATTRLSVGAHVAGDPAADVVESDAVRAALDAIPLKQRGALILRIVYGLSFSELARALDSSEAAAKMTLSRARERFRALYMHEEAH